MSDEDLAFYAWPPRQHGGQHVGTETGVLAVHVATGIGAVCREHRSQLANRAAAVKRLREALSRADLHTVRDFEE